MHPDRTAEKPRTPFLDSKLAALGFDTYDRYLGSSHWRTLRVRYLADPDTPSECLCGETEGLHLHHLTYFRLGSERLSDLRPLCPPCHADVHVLARRGLMSFDLSDYASPERAEQYARASAEVELRKPPEQREAERLEAVETVRKYVLRRIRAFRVIQPPDGPLPPIGRQRDQYRLRHRKASQPRGAVGETLRQCALHGDPEELALILQLLNDHRDGADNLDEIRSAAAALRRADAFRRTPGLQSAA